MAPQSREIGQLCINKIQQDATGAGIYYCKLTLHVSGIYRPHHQYIKL